MLKRAKPRLWRFQLGHRNLEPTLYTVLAFADDLVVFAADDRDLQQNVNIMQEELRSINMDINPDKTKCMKIGRRPHRVMRILRLKGSVLEQVQVFKYLGARINESGYMDKEVSQRLGAAGRLFNAARKGFLNKKEVTKKTKISVYKSTHPILLL